MIICNNLLQINLNMFNKLSYFEFFSHDGQYVSRFPSGKTTAGRMPVSGMYHNYLFPQMHKVTTSELTTLLSQHLRALAENSLMFSDFYWFVDTNYTSAIVSLESTVYEGSQRVPFIRYIVFNIKEFYSQYTDTLPRI
jgi:hypothetical protein